MNEILKYYSRKEFDIRIELLYVDYYFCHQKNKMTYNTGNLQLKIKVSYIFDHLNAGEL
jgi:hypothetical protein